MNNDFILHFKNEYNLFIKDIFNNDEMYGNIKYNRYKK